jgi:hypothetical protein
MLLHDLYLGINRKNQFRSAIEHYRSVKKTACVLLRISSISEGRIDNEATAFDLCDLMEVSSFTVGFYTQSLTVTCHMLPQRY